LNKSLFLVPVALALALTFIGCSSDSGSDTDHYYPSFATDIAAIQADFDAGAPTVKLLKDVAFQTTDDPLIIASGKTLDLNGNMLTDSSDGNILVIQGNVIDSTADKTGHVLFTNQSYVLAPNDAFITNNISATEEKIIYVANMGSASVVGAAPAAGVKVVSITTASQAEAAEAAIGAGSVGIVLLPSLTLDGALTVGAGTLYITGDLTLGTAGVTNNAPVVVSKSVDTTKVLPANVAFSGALKAKSLKSNSDGGKFPGIVQLTGGDANSNVLAGSFAALQVSGAAALAGDVEFAGNASTIFGQVIVSDADTTLKGSLTVGGATVNKTLAIGTTATLTTIAPVNLNTGGAITLTADSRFVLSGAGRLTAANYALTSADNAGSISTAFTSADNPAGSLITLAPTGISSSGLPGGTPTLVFGNGLITLDFKADVTIGTLALELTNGGTVTLSGAPAGGSRTLTLADAGSILTGATDPYIAGTVGAAKLIIAAIPGVGGNAGSLVAGTAAEANTGLATFGTISNYITKGVQFVVTATGGTTAANAYTQVTVTGANANINSQAGSVALFGALN
jgi:hypothetical protein